MCQTVFILLMFLFAWYGEQSRYIAPTDGSSAISYLASDQDKIRFVHEFPAMGVRFRVIAFVNSDEDTNQLKQLIQQRTEHLESVFSDYRKDSEISRISTGLHHDSPVQVSRELFELCRRSQQFVDLTNGAFDPSIGPVSKIWRFARKRNRMPDPSTIDEAMLSVGWQHIDLSDDLQIALKRPQMQLDFGGIAKGFAADQIFFLLQSRSITSTLVDAGGDIRVSAAPKGKLGWKVGLERSKKLKLNLRVSNTGIATSGATRQRLSKQGTQYSHIIDPRTGQPVTHNWNVTVIANDATAADALASAFSVLGKHAGLKIANSSTEIYAMFLDVKSGEIVYSDGFEQFIEK